MRKIGLLSLALVLALGGLGIGYAMWSDTLTITGFVNNGWVDVNFHSQVDNDPSGGDDPSGQGLWSGLPAPTWSGPRYDKDVASTTSSFNWAVQPATVGNFATMTITNGYPSYWGSVIWDVQNDGSIPVKLASVALVETSLNAQSLWTGSVALTIGVRYYVDIDDNAQPHVHAGPVDADDDFSFILSAMWTDQIDPVTWTDDPHNGLGFLDVTVHVEQGATQKANYDFVIEYQFDQWNPH